jgi:hypothetical protein
MFSKHKYITGRGLYSNSDMQSIKRQRKVFSWPGQTQYRSLILLQQWYSNCYAEHYSRKTELPLLSLARPTKYCDNVQSGQAKHRPGAVTDKYAAKIKLLWGWWGDLTHCHFICHKFCTRVNSGFHGQKLLLFNSVINFYVKYSLISVLF